MTPNKAIKSVPGPPPDTPCGWLHGLPLRSSNAIQIRSGLRLQLYIRPLCGRYCPGQDDDACECDLIR